MAEGLCWEPTLHRPWGNYEMGWVVWCPDDKVALQEIILASG